MPTLTPTRALSLLTAFLFVSFLWTWGLPHQYAAPALPVADSDVPNEPITGQLIPEPLVENAGGGQGASQKGTPTTETSAVPSTANTGPEMACKNVRGASDVMVVVRTGKAEMGHKLPANLTTILSCVPNVLFFGDYEGKIDGFPVYDALDTVANATKTKHEEFSEYDKMQADKGYTPSVDKAKALDKWKTLPMVYKTAVLAPSHRFYVFIEPETILSWTNVLQWFQRLDYRIQYYIRVPNTVDSKEFAQWGPGIILSYSALQHYRTAYQDRYTTEWEPQVASECCGDVLETAMRHSQVQPSNAHALMKAESPSALMWSQDHWCRPVVSWSRMTPSESNLFFDSQQAWTEKHGWDKPYLHYNAFEQLVRPNLVETKENWDNISSDTQLKAEKGRREKLAKQKAEKDAKEVAPKDQSVANPPSALSKRDESPSPPPDPSLADLLAAAADSPSTCQATCFRTEDCVQWKHTTAGDGECHLGKAIRLGSPTSSKSDAKWTSGWMLDRITKVTNDWGKCESVGWGFE